MTDPRPKWNKPGIPHKGWTLEYVETLDEAEFVCEMCDQEDIRYVHHLNHPEYGGISVGCVCACAMTGDSVGPKKAERRARNAAAREKRAAERKAMYAELLAIKEEQLGWERHRSASERLRKLLGLT